MQNVCMDSYYTTFDSYEGMLDYHRNQSANSRWQRSKVSDLEVAPLDKGSSLVGKLGVFASGTSQEAVDDTVNNLGLAMMVDHHYYPILSAQQLTKACWTGQKSVEPHFQS